MKVIVSADDFGFSESVNRGIIEAYKKGIVTSTTIMMNMPGVENAFELYKENPDIGFGVHLTLTAGRPVSQIVPSLTKENGEFYQVNELKEHAKIEDVYKEMKAQIEKFLSFGVTPTHLDNHHFINKFPGFMDTIFKLAKEYSLPVRIMDDEEKAKALELGIKTCDFFVESFYKENARAEVIESALKQYPDDCIVEVLSHPGYMDEETMKRTTYNVQRENELRELIKLKDNRVLKEIGVEFISYKDI